jgi:hypothetical protein
LHAALDQGGDEYVTSVVTTKGEMVGAGAAARMLEISGEHLRRLGNAGKIPFELTVHGYRVYEADDVGRLRRERLKAAA